MSDPRVGPLLSRLGGLYRDPSRVDRDASSLLKSSVGKHLTPKISNLVENNGETAQTLCFNGTIAIHFRGNDYDQLMDIYLPPGYPVRPPTCFVRLGAPNMYLKENHRHVGSDGQVYLPYLNEWNPLTHTLIELVIAMSSVFSADPPVFTRAPPPAVATPPPPPPPPVSRTISPATRRQLEDSLAREAAEANMAAELARKAAEEEEKQRLAQLEWDARNLQATKEKVRKKIHAYLVEHAKSLHRDLVFDLQDEEKLKQSTLDSQMESLESQKSRLQKETVVLDEKLAELKDWLASAKEAAEEQDKQQLSADDMVTTDNPIHAQMLQLSAQNASLTDALYFLDKGFHARSLEVNSHLKEVRRLAKKQFLVRAHLVKINQVQMQLS